MDRTEGGHAYLKEKFQTGLVIPNGNTVRLSRIVQLAPANEGAGHGMSVIDVLLGAFRWCVNERDRTDASTRMLPPTGRVIGGQEVGGSNPLSPISTPLVF